MKICCIILVIFIHFSSQTKSNRTAPETAAYALEGTARLSTPSKPFAAWRIKLKIPKLSQSHATSFPTATPSPTASTTKLFIGTTASARPVMTEMESTASKSKETALRRTFATFTPSAFTTRRFEEATAFATRDTKEMDESVI